ncbi:baculoviral IAP repeat-containing protein 7-A-like, partial [Dreissena polymorpha]|uniref:baculoviral IAP repeat-containing protein 7-A-like n=1 Tax=Dreissena polymorpha TaxID=45954 RepID=UPI002264AC44
MPSFDQVALHPQYTELKRNQVNAKPYRHPEKSTIDTRLETFQNANFQSDISPEQLADAGLYSKGVGDHVRCFACDGGLRNWEVHVDPWTEHCRWFPSCLQEKSKGTRSSRMSSSILDT